MIKGLGTTGPRTAAANIDLVARVLDDPSQLDTERTWYSNGTTGYRHTDTSCKRLPKRRSTVYHSLTLREARTERTCPDCLLPGIAGWLGITPAHVLASIADDVSAAEDLLARLENARPELTTFLLAEIAGALEERLKGRAQRAAALQGGLNQLGDRLGAMQRVVEGLLRDNSALLEATVAVASLRPRQRTVLPDSYATAEEMSVLGDVKLGTSAQHTFTGALLNEWIDSVQALTPPSSRLEEALAWASRLKLESLAQLEHVPAAEAEPGASAQGAAMAAWRTHLPMVVVGLVERWESMLSSRMAESPDTLVAYYSRFHPSDPAMRLALLLYDTSITHEGKRLLKVPSTVGTWLQESAPDSGSYGQTRYIEAMHAKEHSDTVLDTALALWDPAANYSAYRSFASALGAAAALN